MKKDLLSIRGPKPEDLPYIYSTWINTLYFQGIWRNTRYMRSKKIPALDKKVINKYSTVLGAIILRPSICIKLYVLKEDEDVIVAYSVTEEMPRDTILHWVYVRDEWKRLGLARDLAPESPTIITHLTKEGDSVLRHLNIRAKLISFPLAYEILENTFQTQSSKINEPKKEGESNDRIPNN